MAIALVLALFRGLERSQLGRKPVHLTMRSPPGAHLAVDTDHPTIALTPDGSQLVFLAEQEGKRRLYVRRLADPEAHPIEGTDGGASPFFSPGGEYVAFFQGQALKRVSLLGGLPKVVFPQTTGTIVNRGAAWGAKDAVIIAGSANSGLSMAMAGQDTSSSILSGMITKPDSGGHAWPEALPGGENILFTDNRAAGTDQANVAVVSLETRKVTTLVNGGVNPRYSGSGYILYARGSSLYAVPFATGRLTTTGTESKLLDGLMVGANGAAQFAVTSSGTTLAYVSGEFSSGERELVWVDREGRTETLLDKGTQFSTPRISRDGTRLALMCATGSNLDVWVLNLARGDFTPWTTHPGEDFRPAWRSDGSLAFASEIGEDKGEEGPGLAWMAGQHSPPERLLETPGDGNFDFPSSWSPDGQWLVFTAARAGKSDIYILRADTRTAAPFIATPFEEYAATFSPDGKWIAYVSERSGQPEVYASPFPGPGDPIPISTRGGVEPLWSLDGREMFYREDRRLMAVSIGGGSRLNPGSPVPLFEGRFETSESFPGGDRNYDISPDGKRFVMVRRKNPATPTLIHIVLNWPEALKLTGR